MKATTWLCPVLTFLCAAKLVCTAQRGSYGSYHPAMDGMDSSANAIQNDYFLSKRNKPSLSIVNPLDVLRQRLLLEIARRQMKENTRQVELNRAILKNVGKRMFSKHPHPMDSIPEHQWEALNAHQSQRQQQQQQQQLLNANMQREPMAMVQPYDLELIPSTLIFDYLQQRQPWMAHERTSVSFDNYDIASDNEQGDGEGEGDDDVNANVAADGGLEDLDVVSDVKLALHPSSDGQHHETTVKKPINRSGHEGDSFAAKSLLSSLKHHKMFNNDFKLNDLATLELNEEGSNAGNTGNTPNNSNNSGNNSNNKNGINDDNQVQRYLYHLHKNHLTRK